MMAAGPMPMPELSGHDLLDEWRQMMDSVLASAASVAGRSEVPRELLKASQRQLELVQEVIERERKLQGELVARAVAPVDAIFDLLEETGVTLRRQAEALESAGRALEETAGLMKHQAERFERTISALRQPTDIAKAAAGAKPRAKKKGR
jgi:hypothetical protein